MFDVFSMFSGVQCYLWFYQRYSRDPQHGDRGLWVAGDGARARDDRDIAVYCLPQGGRTRGHGALRLALCAYNHTNYSNHWHDVTSSVLIAICFALPQVYVFPFYPQTFIHSWRDSNPELIANLLLWLYKLDCYSSKRRGWLAGIDATVLSPWSWFRIYCDNKCLYIHVNTNRYIVS